MLMERPGDWRCRGGVEATALRRFEAESCGIGRRRRWRCEWCGLWRPWSIYGGESWQCESEAGAPIWDGCDLAVAVLAKLRGELQTRRDPNYEDADFWAGRRCSVDSGHRRTLVAGLLSALICWCILLPPIHVRMCVEFVGVLVII